MPRRRLLIASATALPLLFATAGCRSADLFAGPDPLGGPPPLAHDTVVLDHVITAEVALVSLYKSAISAGHGGSSLASLLASLLGQHEEHLNQLRARLVVPASASPAAPVGTVSPAASPAAAVSIARLHDAERASSAVLTRQLMTVSPALAELFASIAASDTTHATALAAL